jgi:hypothetical protein
MPTMPSVNGPGSGSQRTASSASRCSIVKLSSVMQVQPRPSFSIDKPPDVRGWQIARVSTEIRITWLSAAHSPQDKAGLRSVRPQKRFITSWLVRLPPNLMG